MRLRRFFILLFTLFALLSCWSVVCTWKKYQLQQEVKSFITKAAHADYVKINQLLVARYSEGGEAVWSLPWIGPIYYRHLCRYALSRGIADTGGSTTEVVVDEIALLERLGKSDSDFQDFFQQAKTKAKELEEDSFIDLFCDLAEEKGKKISRLLKNENELIFQNADDNATIRKKLHRWTDQQLKNCLKLIKQKLDPQGVIGYQVISNKGYLTIVSPTIEDENVEELINHPKKLKCYVDFCQNATLKGFYDTLDKDLKEKQKKRADATGSLIFLTEANGGVVACTPDSQKLVEECAENSKLHLLWFDDRDPQYKKFCIVKSVDQSCLVSLEHAKVKPTAEKDKSILDIQLTQQSHLKINSLLKRTGTNLLIFALDNESVLPLPLSSDTTDLPRSFSLSIPSTGAEQKAQKLEHGALPTPLKIIAKTLMNPATSTYRPGYLLIFLGFMLLLLFMLLYYGVAGLLAGVVLSLNLFFTIGIVAQLPQASLTLESVLGIILALTMSLQAIVFLFERISEQSRQEIEGRYRENIRSIFIIQTPVCLLGLLLWFFGLFTHFATTLLIGMICSFVTTALVLHELIVSFMHWPGAQYLSWSTPLRYQGKPTIHFFEKRKKAYLFSFLLISLGIGLAFYQGMIQGWGVTGSHTYKIRCAKSTTLKVEKLKETLQARLKKAGVSQRQLSEKDCLFVQSLYQPTEFQIVTNLPAVDSQELVIATLQELGLKYVNPAQVGETLAKKTFTLDQITETAPRLNKMIKSNMRWFLIFVVLLLLLYSFFCFRKFALVAASSIRVLHDVLAFLSFTAILNLWGIHYTMDEIFCISLLLVVGYAFSSNVQLFTRLQDKLKASSYAKEQVADETICVTLNHTLMVALATLPLGVSFYFGGQNWMTLGHLLLWGILWHAYSSIFIAVPLANDVVALRRFLWGKEETIIVPKS